MYDNSRFLITLNNNNSEIHLGLNPGAQSIDSLLNNSVAPNVTLTNRGSVVPDPQLSPNFPQSLLQQQQHQQQLSPNQQRANAPFSPQASQSKRNF